MACFPLTMDKMRILAISEVSTCTASYECSTCSVSKMLNSNINKYADQSKTVELQRSQKQQGHCFLNERRFNYCAIPQTRFVLACINNYKEKKEGQKTCVCVCVCVCVYFYCRLLQYKIYRDVIIIIIHKIDLVVPDKIDSITVLYYVTI